MKILQPPGWPRPKGYSNGISAEGRLVFLAGQVGWGSEERIVSEDMAGQARQALSNIVAILAEGDAKPEHIVRMDWFVTDRNEYNASLKEIGAAYRELIGNHYPAMMAVEISGLVEDGAKVEIEVTAVVPD